MPDPPQAVQQCVGYSAQAVQHCLPKDDQSGYLLVTWCRLFSTA